ncbi:MAG TPA: two-component regulator propeller domain-containing protein [Bacteroidia bacterium]|nr:two-component regulator propeller domain-containing protein [Bacteroidia bacterium]
MSKKLLFILFCFVNLSIYRAQDYNFKHYGQKQGLTNANIKCIFQDSYGYIWFATQGGGISKFDGKSFTNYDKQDGLVGNDVICITEDENKNIWIGTVDGVSKYNRKKFINYTTENGLKENKVFHILCDGSKIWISTFGGGIAVLENETFSYLNTANGLSSDKVFSVFKDKSGKYWIGTSKGGINLYNGKSFTVIKESKNFNSASAFCFHESSDGKIWIGTPGKGIYYIENNIFHQVDIPQINTDYISKIVEDKQHNIWCATEHGLLKIYKNLNHKLFNKDNGLAGVDIPSVLCDYEGEIWVSCFGNGIYKLTNEAISVYTKQHGLDENRVFAFCNKGNGFLFSTANGLNSFYNNVIENISLPNELSGTIITSLYYEENLLFVGTDSKGLFILNETSKNIYKLSKVINKIDSIDLKTIISSILREPKSNTIWFSLYGTGIVKLQNFHPTLLCKENGLLPTNDVTCAYLSDSKLWIGSIGNGAFTLNTSDNSIRFLDKKDGLTSSSIFSIKEINGHILIGSIDEGLFIFTNHKFINLNKKTGLLSNTINTIQNINSNELWVGTDLGINKISLNSDFSLKSIKAYTDEDGLKSSAIEQNASIEQNGYIYFGTGEGLVSYNAKEDINSDAKPKVLITELLLKYSKIDSAKVKFDSLSKLNLPINPVFTYKQNDITFKFKALSTQTTNYQFLLEGYDKDWSPVQTNNEAVFTNLSPGKYIFKLKAINKYNIESDVLEYSFEITPPFYMRWWFFVLSIITIIASIYFFIKYRTHKLTKEKQVLEQKVNERTSELKSANLNLNIAIEEIKDSINYAERIQSAILPNISVIKDNLPNGFILFKPRDIVSGDFYWFNKSDDKLFLACVDCTGHGVPGAFMSMIGNSLLNEIILTKKITSPSAILSNLNKSIFKVLKQNTSESKDGMDMALCMIDLKTNTLTYAGANRELLQIRNGELIEYKPTKNAIGGFTDSSTIFKETVIEIKPNDLFYMTTDGYADQFGGEKGKKLMTKNFKDFLLQIHTQPMPKQQEMLDKKIVDWMGTHEQVDDILVVGIKL